MCEGVVVSILNKPSNKILIPLSQHCVKFSSRLEGLLYWFNSSHCIQIWVSYCPWHTFSRCDISHLSLLFAVHESGNLMQVTLIYDLSEYLKLYFSPFGCKLCSLRFILANLILCVSICNLKIMFAYIHILIEAIVCNCLC